MPEAGFTCFPPAASCLLFTEILISIVLRIAFSYTIFIRVHVYAYAYIFETNQ